MNRFHRLGLALGLAALSTVSQAALVGVSYSLLSGSTWQASFSFSNGAGEDPAPGLTVFFDEALYANLANAVAPAGWDPLVVQPDLVLGAGFFDAYVYDDADALQPGQTLSGFSVQFDFLGTGAPGTLGYEFYRFDGNDLVSLQTGTTITVPAADLPEPATAWLGAAALLGLLGASRRRAAPAPAGQAEQGALA
ncbi:MAG: hypothetical protein QM750_12040 [Rubrivivax sp.]